MSSARLLSARRVLRSLPIMLVVTGFMASIPALSPTLAADQEAPPETAPSPTEDESLRQELETEREIQETESAGEAMTEDQIETDKKNAEAEAQRRAAMKTKDAREQAIDELLSQVETAPDSYDLRYALANAYHESAHLHSALVQFNEAVRIDSTQSRAWVNRGVVLKELGRTQDAEESFRKALAANPQDGLAHINLGDMLLTQKKYPAAVDAYRTAIRIDPTFPNSYYSLAIAFAESGLYRDAARAWRKCAELATARGGASDPATAERSLENAKLMDEIIADAERELKEREAKKMELEGSGAGKPESGGGAVKKGG